MPPYTSYHSSSFEKIIALILIAIFLGFTIYAIIHTIRSRKQYEKNWLLNNTVKDIERRARQRRRKGQHGITANDEERLDALLHPYRDHPLLHDIPLDALGARLKLRFVRWFLGGGVAKQN